MAQPSNKLGRNLVYAFLAFLLLFAIFSMFNLPESQEEIALSDLANKVNNEEVKKIEISGEKLTVELTNDESVKAQKEGDAALSETLRNYGVEADKLKNVEIRVKDISGTQFFLGTILPYLIIFALITGAIWFMMRQAQKGNNQAMSFGKSTARLAQPKNGQKVTFKDVAGNKEAKEELGEVVDFLRNPQKFLKLGARIPRGVILVGPPGTGKTMMARAISGEAKVPFFHISGSEFVEMFVGVGASRVRDLFKEAKKSAPAIVFIDEIDAVGRHRGAGLGGGHDEREQTLNQILVEMDGFEKDTNVIVVAATNRPDILDPALLRPGRFDRRIALSLPDIDDREAILKTHAKNKPINKDADLREIANRTPGFSGADLENVVNEGAILTGRKNKKEIQIEELLEAIEKVLLGPQRKSFLLSKEEKKITAYHEAGHAVVSTILEHADPVQKVSIIARGRAAGYTMNLPEKERKLVSESYFKDTISTLLGGYAAEKMIFGELTTGASDDLRKAYEMARKIVAEYGMSEKIGPLNFGNDEETVFLGRELSSQRIYSEKTAEGIDEEVEKMIKDAHEKTQKVLEDNKEKLDKVANELIEKETIEKEEFGKIMGLEVKKEEEKETKEVEKEDQEEK